MAGPQTPGGNPMTLLNSTPGGSSTPGMGMQGASVMGGGNPIMLIAEAIGTGKNIEYSNPRTGLGQTLLAGLAPSGRQIAKDPVGMGIPTLLGMPFLTPFTSSKKAQAARPEWEGIWKLGS